MSKAPSRSFRRRRPFVGGFGPSDDQAVLYALVISLAVVVLDELKDDMPKMSLAEGTVEIGAPRRGSNDFSHGALEGSARLGGVERVPVEQEVPLPEEESVLDIEQVSSDLHE